MVNQQALEVWQKKLDYLQAQDAIVSGGAQKFELQQQIEEAKHKIAELSNPLQIAQLAEPEISIAHLPSAVEHFVGRDKELDQLDAAWEDPKTRVISLVAGSPMRIRMHCNGG